MHLRESPNSLQRFAISLQEISSADWFARTESERKAVYVDSHVFETSDSETVRKCVGLNDNECIQNVQKTKGTAVDAISARKDSTRPQDSGDFC